MHKVSCVSFVLIFRQILGYFVTRFEVFMVVKTEARVFWIVRPFSVVVGYQQLGGPCCHHFHFMLKMEATRFFGMVVSSHNTTKHHNPEDLNLKDGHFIVCLVTIQFGIHTVPALILTAATSIKRCSYK
jgi:hypothetical protein